MRTEFVIAVSDVHVEYWDGAAPRYRCYVNNELFAERTWIWTNHYLEEELQIQAEPGTYTIRYELVDAEHAALTTNNFRIKIGPASVDQQGNIQITTSENQQ